MSVFHIQDGLFTVRGLGTGEKVHLKKYMRGFPVLLVEEGELSAAIILDPQRMRMLAEHLSIWAEEIEPSAQAVTGGGRRNPSERERSTVHAGRAVRAG